MARDANDQMLPIAYVVVEVENKDTWSWFLDLLIDDLSGVECCASCTFVSDQQKVHIFFQLYELYIIQLSSTNIYLFLLEFPTSFK